VGCIYRCNKEWNWKKTGECPRDGTAGTPKKFPQDPLWIRGFPLAGNCNRGQKGADPVRNGRGSSPGGHSDRVRGGRLEMAPLLRPTGHSETRMPGPVSRFRKDRIRIRPEGKLESLGTGSRPRPVRGSKRKSKGRIRISMWEMEEVRRDST
jgi:hypothetical protein